MTARLGSVYRYFGKLVLVPFRYFSIDIYRNIDIFDNTSCKPFIYYIRCKIVLFILVYSLITLMYSLMFDSCLGM